ncbi:hypothetical protein AAKU64_004041 [Undibacterium sp. GrIS 1.8]|uniref:hypothetical protein n=1 Tax=unclassified Undibacterium TaxID=2630295 RepID=UPI003390DA14
MKFQFFNSQDLRKAALTTLQRLGVLECWCRRYALLGQFCVSSNSDGFAACHHYLRLALYLPLAQSPSAQSPSYRAGSPYA